MATEIAERRSGGIFYLMTIRVNQQLHHHSGMMVTKEITTKECTQTPVIMYQFNSDYSAAKIVHAQHNIYFVSTRSTITDEVSNHVSNSTIDHAREIQISTKSSIMTMIGYQEFGTDTTGCDCVEDLTGVPPEACSNLL